MRDRNPYRTWHRPRGVRSVLLAARATRRSHRYIVNVVREAPVTRFAAAARHGVLLGPRQIFGFVLPSGAGEGGDRLCRLEVVPVGNSLRMAPAHPVTARCRVMHGRRRSRRTTIVSSRRRAVCRTGAEAPQFSQDARRHAARNRVKRQSAAGGVPLCPQARGASATAYTKHVRPTNNRLRDATIP